MNTKAIKFWLSFMILMGSQISISAEVELVSRYTGGTYVSATYSFWHSTRDRVDVVNNDWEILFEGREDFEDFFRVNIATDDRSHIVDLGESCGQAFERAIENRGGGSETAPVVVGHCYVTYNQDRRGTIITVFRVVDHTKSERVVLDDIQILFMDRGGILDILIPYL